jgi:hypothetical protein
MVHSKALACLLATSALIWAAGSTGQTRERSRGGPRDWSHSRVVASRFGPDNDRQVTRDWRTIRKHLQIDGARAQRAGAGDLRTGPTDLREWFRQRPIVAVKPPHAAAANGSPELDWNLRTGGYGSVVGYPAKFNFDILASNCADVNYFTVDQAGASSIVNVIAITNSYAGCPNNSDGKTPTVKFGLRLTAGTATSPVPSLDGQTLYVIESRATGVILHGINVNNIAAPVGTYNYSTNVWSNAHTLAAPSGLATSEQKFQMTFAGVVNNLSSPFLDYVTNQMFFGDSVGRVHRVANVNTTAATRDVTNFPVSCGTAALQSPVFVNGQIIVTSANGHLYRIDTTLPPPYTCIPARQGGEGTSVGVGGGLSAPLIDVTNNKILVATNYDVDYSMRGLGVFNLMFTSGQASVSQAPLGGGVGGLAPVSPALDDDFWSTNDGNVYAAGSPNPGVGTYLVRIPYNGVTLNSSAAAMGYATLARSGSAATVGTSPVTEFLTASSLSNPDFIYIGGSGGTYTYMNRIASKFAGTTGVPVPMANSFAVTGGISSGIGIDTRTTLMTGTTATANIYFGTIGIPSTTQSTIVQLAQQF